MSFNSWTKEQVEQLIEEYKQHPILYSVTNKYYHNKKLRAIALNEVLKKIQKTRPETSEVDLTKKIYGLRTSYGHERKKLLKSLQNADSDNEIYRPSLWYFDLLTFLNSNIVSRDKFRDESLESKSEEKGIQDESQMDMSDGLALDSAGYHSMSTSDPLSDPESEPKSYFEEESSLKKKKIEDNLSLESKLEYSPDRDDNAWLCYLSTLLEQIRDPQNKVLLRHKITKMLYEEIENQFCDNSR